MFTNSQIRAKKEEEEEAWQGETDHAAIGRTRLMISLVKNPSPIAKSYK